MKKIKCIFIDCVKREVTKIEIEGGLQSIYNVLGCDTITAAERHLFGRTHTLYVDDNGLMIDKKLGAFQIKKGQILSGHGLIIGCDEEGNDIDVDNAMLACIDPLISWHNVEDLPEPSFEIYSFD
jgi:hypothetical protein